MDKYNQLFSNIFKQQLAGEESIAMLEKITQQYPYFTPAQFFLLHLTDQSSPAFIEQAKKTSLLFNNNFLLNYHLLQISQQQKEPTTEIKQSTSIDITEILVEETLEITDETAIDSSMIEPDVELTLVSQIATENTATIILPVDEDDLPVDGEEDMVERSGDEVSFKIAETLASISIESNTNEDTVSFEPLHTSDYFASLGVRLSDELKPSDRLGLQMKSFTQWLKIMKKIHADQLKGTGHTDDLENKKVEQNIQQLADASNVDNATNTEAMVDVLLQQGKIIKAIEVLEKLSLLIPSKKVYFAAKIKQLKA